MTNSIIQAVTDYIMMCPLLKDGALRVDALGDGEIEYVVETGVYTPVLKTYIDGSELKQYQFNFGSREYYSMDRIVNMQNSMFYEQFADWIEEQNKKDILPVMPDGCEAESVEVLSPGYLFDASQRNARYQIQLRLIYRKKSNREVM